MAYTPELDQEVSAYLRRIAWAAGKPMSVVLQELVLHAMQSVDLPKVCPACEDTSQCRACRSCTLAGPPSAFLVWLFKDSSPLVVAARSDSSLAS